MLLNSPRGFAELGLATLTAGEPSIPLLQPAGHRVRHEARGAGGAERGAAGRVRGDRRAVIELASVVAAIREKFPQAIAEKNVAAATEAHELASRAAEPAHA